MLSRRDIFWWVGAAGWCVSKVSDSVAASNLNPVRVRTITAGVELTPALELERVEAAVAFLTRARRVLEGAGYELQVTRVAINPIIGSLAPAARDKALDQLRRIDELVGAHGAVVSTGPILTEDRSDDSLVE